MKLLKITLAFLLLISLQIAAAQWLNVPPPVEARNLMVVGGSIPVSGCTPTSVSQASSDDSVVLSGVNVGQGFTMSGTTLSTISVWALACEGATPTLTMRFGTSADLSTYTATANATCTVGETVFTFNQGGLTNGAQYYFGLKLLAATDAQISKLASSGYAGANNIEWYNYTTTSWDLSGSSIDHDLKFSIVGCQ